MKKKTLFQIALWSTGVIVVLVLARRLVGGIEKSVDDTVGVKKKKKGEK
ncbi:MAG: hypothetical protein PHS95_00240 [Candidatus Pacebacteria bacterium]|nr:hypothetical protein [Candidatus Paceibacterota bacterium]